MSACQPSRVALRLGLAVAPYESAEAEAERRTLRTTKPSVPPAPVVPEGVAHRSPHLTACVAAGFQHRSPRFALRVAADVVRITARAPDRFPHVAPDLGPQARPVNSIVPIEAVPLGGCGKPGQGQQQRERQADLGYRFHDDPLDERELSRVVARLRAAGARRHGPARRLADRSVAYGLRR
jgi:hypothetical protein